MSDSCCFEPTLYALGSQVEGLDALAVPDSHGGDEWTRHQSIAHCTLATAAGLFCAQQPDLSIANGLLPPLMRLATSREGEEERLLSVLPCLLPVPATCPACQVALCTMCAGSRAARASAVRSCMALALNSRAALMEVQRSVLLPLMADQTDITTSCESHVGADHRRVNNAEYIWQVRLLKLLRHSAHVFVREGSARTVS